MDSALALLCFMDPVQVECCGMTAFIMPIYGTCILQG